MKIIITMKTLQRADTQIFISDSELWNNVWSCKEKAIKILSKIELIHEILTLLSRSSQLQISEDETTGERYVFLVQIYT